ncbi:conserved hypothetical protein [Paraburkholderia atlantica]|uniref:Uncharacterized protein n=1 Tax=Paraburkholderia atlantica TaxID=2654982 RepID=D5WI94_PARAM|nr:three component ABC system middle component [Paraburkholderia atlantica]ADG18189.1 conserved hypothetical protein [Paraburkholderia atlantica]
MHDIKISSEYRALFNPAFCAVLLREASLSAERTAKVRGTESFSFCASFLILPAVLHEPIRRKLPKTVATSFATWLSSNPLLRSQFVSLAGITKEITRQGMLFGVSHGALSIEAGRLTPSGSMKLQLPEYESGATEMGECVRAAQFMGRWLPSAGNTTTVLALLGMRA